MSMPDSSVPTPAVPAEPSGWSRRRALGFMAAGLGGAAVLAAPTMPSARADSYADLTLSNLTDYPAARDNLTVGLMRTPEQYGAVGDGTTDDATAIQAGIDDLATGGGGMLWFAARTYLIGSTITIKSGVTLASGTRHRSLLVNTGTATLKAKSTLTGWMFDTVGTSATVGMAIVGLNILGPGAGLSASVGGIRLRSTLNARLQWVSINSFSNSCISADQLCTSLAIEDCVIQTDSSGRTLTAVCGALDLGGTDHYIRSIQCNGGQSNTSGADGKTHVTYPGQFYRTGAHIHCITSWIFDLNGEFGDVGIYLSSTASNNRFIGTRADVNAGHGWYIDGATDNQFVGCYAVGEGFAAYDTYDGAIHVNGAKRNRWTNFMHFPYGGITVRFGWNDATTGNNQAEQNVVDFPAGPAAWVMRDLHNSTDPVRYSLQPAGAGTRYERPPSRYMAGNTWWDTTTGMPTYSDGTVWRNAAGDVVGNLLSPDQATGRTALKWAAVDSKGTVTGLYTSQGSSAVQTAFADVAKLVLSLSTSAAVPGGAYQIQATERFAVTVGQAYTVGCKTLADPVAAKVAMGVNWFNSAGTYLSTTYATGSTNSTTALTASTGLFTAPANAATAQPLAVFSRTGMASGEGHYLNFTFAVHGTVSDYIAP